MALFGPGPCLSSALQLSEPPHGRLQFVFVHVSCILLYLCVCVSCSSLFVYVHLSYLRYATFPWQVPPSDEDAAAHPWSDMSSVFVLSCLNVYCAYSCLCLYNISCCQTCRRSSSCCKSEGSRDQTAPRTDYPGRSSSRSNGRARARCVRAKELASASVSNISNAPVRGSKVHK